MRKVSMILFIIFMGVSQPSIGDSKFGIDISLDINTMLKTLIDRTEKYWGQWSKRHEETAVPKLAATYIQVGIKFTTIAEQMLRSIPKELRDTICDSADTGQLNCLNFVAKAGLELNDDIANQILSQQFSELRRLYHSLHDQFEELEAEIVIRDSKLFTDAISNISTRGVIIMEAESTLFDRTLGGEPVKLVEMASQFEVLGRRAVKLGDRFSKLLIQKAR